MKDTSFTHEQFCNLLDETITQLEADRADNGGKKRNTTPAPTVVTSSTEAGEEDMVEVTTTTESNENEREIIGKASKKFIVITDIDGNELLCYGSAAEAARCEEINPTTVRTRCAKETIDKQNRKWQYEDNNE